MKRKFKTAGIGVFFIMEKPDARKLQKAESGIKISIWCGLSENQLNKSSTSLPSFQSLQISQPACSGKYSANVSRGRMATYQPLTEDPFAKPTALTLTASKKSNSTFPPWLYSGHFSDRTQTLRWSSIH
jgi:hypothetical protein